MAAMRRKDRRGPRMTTVCADATDGSVPEGGEKASAAVSAKDVPLLTQRYSRTPRQAVSARRGKFIAVASSEPWTLRQLRADRTTPSYGVGRGNISTVSPFAAWLSVTRHAFVSQFHRPKDIPSVGAVKRFPQSTP